MALVILLAIVSSAALSGVAAAPQLDRDRAELIGPVKMTVSEFQTLKGYDGNPPDPYRTPAGTDIYDRAGNLVERKHFTTDFIDDQHLQRIDPETVVIRSNMGDKRQLMKFDPTGKLVRLQVFIGADGKGSMLEDTRYKHDAKGREIEEDLFDEDGKPGGVIIITRDQAENVIEREYRFGHAVPFPEVRYYKYEFDSRGNWIKQIQSGNDPEHNQKDIAPVGILFRTITYFDSAAPPAQPPTK